MHKTTKHSNLHENKGETLLRTFRANWADWGERRSRRLALMLNLGNKGRPSANRLLKLGAGAEEIGDQAHEANVNCHLGCAVCNEYMHLKVSELSMISLVLAAKILGLTVKPGLYKAHPRTDDFMTITRLPRVIHSRKIPRSDTISMACFSTCLTHITAPVPVTKIRFTIYRRHVWVFWLRHIFDVTGSTRGLKSRRLTGRQSPSFCRFLELRDLDKHPRQGRFDSLKP